MSADQVSSQPQASRTGNEGAVEPSRRSMSGSVPASGAENGEVSENTGSRHHAEELRESRISNDIGTQVGHYQILDQVGGGALTAVYRARDTVLDRLVALKVLLQGADATTRERFRREARTAAMLEHPNIVRTYQVGQVAETGQSYIAMELVEGPSLAGLLEQVKVLSVHDAATLLEPIARALAYAHERGVVHRDVKPGNILLRFVDSEHPLGVETSASDSPIAPLLSDFGIARALDSPDLTSEGRTIGTPAFMAPEQCSGSDDVDGRADIYALGAVLYRCLLGRAPYVGPTAHVLHAHVYDPLTVPGDAARRLPPLALSIIQRSMAKDPAGRYATALAMAQDLAALAQTGRAPVTGVHALDEGETEQSASAVVTTTGTGPGSSVVLVAAPTSESIDAGSAAEITETATLPPTPAPGPRRGVRRIDRSGSRVGMIVLGVALIALVSMLALTVFSGVIPALFTETRDEPASDSDVATAVTASGIATSVGGTPGPGSVDGSATSGGGQATGGEGGTPTPAGDASDLDSGVLQRTPTSEPVPLNVSPEFALSNARALLEDRDWSEARNWLIAVQRADPNFESAAVVSMLAEADAYLAALELIQEDYEAALRLLQEASDAVDGAQPYAGLERSVAELLESAPAGRREALREVQDAFVSYAELLASEGKYCEAAEHVDLAQSLDSSAQLQPIMDEYAAACEESEKASAQTPPTGRVLYSAVRDGEYAIFDVSVQADSGPRLVLDQASQPSLSPDGSILAYYSRLPEVQGLAGTVAGPAGDFSGERVRYTNFVEDSRDSAPSWNPQGDRLAYASTSFGDGRSRIYLTWADGNRNTEELGLGKDPAWHPNQDLLVFNGVDESGNNPGLWLMRTDGTGRVQLTDNGNDQRPAWSPDGSSIVFMSSGRDGNWEVYRLDMASGEIARLTNHPAQDGLPVESPDGQYVAFMSDRDGYWALWSVPVAGGDAFLLADIAYELPKWLEHSIQWLN